MKSLFRNICTCGICAISAISLCSCGGNVTGNKESAHSTIVWYMQKPVSDMSHQGMVEESANKIIEKEIGAKLKFQFIDSGSWSDKMNVIISSGEEFDLTWDSDTTFVNNVNKNSYKDVTEYIDKNALDIKAKTNDFAWNVVTFGGKIYGIPSQTFYVPYSSFALKKDLVEKYGFNYKNLKSLEDLEPFLKTIKQNEPGMYPIIATAKSGIPQPVSNYYLRTSIDGVTYDKIKDKFIPEIESPYALERYKTTYNFYQKGYIAKDSASKTELVSEIKSGKYAVFGGRRSASKTTNLYGFECVESDPIYGVIGTSNVSNSLTAVSRTSNNPEKAVQLLNLIWKKSDLSNLLAYGIENVDYTVVSGKGTSDMKIQTKSGNDVKWSIWHNWLGPLWDQWDSPWNTKESLIEMQKVNNTAEVSPILGFTPDTSRFKTEIAMISSINNECSSVLNTGSMPNYEEYIQTVTSRYKEAGIFRVIEEIEKQYAEWKNQK